MPGRVLGLKGNVLAQDQGLIQLQSYGNIDILLYSKKQSVHCLTLCNVHCISAKLADVHKSASMWA